MDIFIINSAKADSVPKELLEKFGYKDFSNRNKETAHRFVYLMLDRILKEFYGTENRSIIFDNEKPVLESGLKQFSVSHSGEYVVLAFSDDKCGVDIEKLKPRDYTAIAKKMGFESASLKDFYFDWTKYEAGYKLGAEIKSEYNFEIPEYAITAVSVNENEKFEVYYNL